MKRKFKSSAIFCLGAIGYSLLEILWRGYTHWSMGLTGGACFLWLHKLNKKLRKSSIFKRCFIGSLIITATEFAVGFVVNIILKLDVWSYKNRPFNILGQVCLLYSILWFLLCLPIMLLSSVLYKISKRL